MRSEALWILFTTVLCAFFLFRRVPPVPLWVWRVLLLVQMLVHVRDGFLSAAVLAGSAVLLADLVQIRRERAGRPASTVSR